MDDKTGFAVFFFPQALEALGDAIKPYLMEGPAGPHLVCREVDTAGGLIEFTVDAQTTAGEAVQLEIMLPANMVRMIISARSDETFGFGPRAMLPVAVPTEAAPALPVVGPRGQPPHAPSQSVPPATEESPTAASTVVPESAARKPKPSKKPKK